MGRPKKASVSIVPVEVSQASREYINNHAKEQSAEELARNTKEPLELVKPLHEEALAALAKKKKKTDFDTGKGATSMTSAQSGHDDTTERVNQTPPKLVGCIHKIWSDEPSS